MTQDLEIHAHLTDGSVRTFTQSDPQECKFILESLNPSHTFNGPRLLIAGERSMSLLRCAQITRLDCLTDFSPDWRHLGGIQEMVVIPESSFGSLPPERRVRVVEEGEQYTVQGRWRFVTGECLHIEITGRARPRMDRAAVIGKILSEVGMWARLPEGGFTLINMSTVTAVDLIPGAPEAPQDAWIADPKGE
jgi:hypothetical protein